MPDDHDDDKDTPNDRTQRMRAIFAANAGKPIAAIFNPYFSPLNPRAVAAKAMSQALGARALREAAQKHLDTQGGLRAGRTQALKIVNS